LRWVCLTFGAAAVAAVLSGCAVRAPTEETFGLQIVNDTGSPATVAYCRGGSSCTRPWWKTTFGRAGRPSTASAPADSLSVFLVTKRGNRCIRVSRYTKSIRLWRATHAECHPPYG
jgi:hypothetical protein